MMWAQELVILLAAGCLMLAWWRGRPMKGAWVLECRSADGETVGLIDAAIHVMRAASRGDLTSVAAQEALADLVADPEVQALLAAAAQSLPTR